MGAIAGTAYSVSLMANYTMFPPWDCSLRRRSQSQVKCLSLFPSISHTFPFHIFGFNRVDSSVGTGRYAGVGTRTRQEGIHFPFQRFPLGQMTYSSPILYPGPKAEPITHLEVSACLLREGRFLLRPSSIQEVSESFSSVTCHSATQPFPSLAL